MGSFVSSSNAKIRLTDKISRVGARIVAAESTFYGEMNERRASLIILRKKLILLDEIGRGNPHTMVSALLEHRRIFTQFRTSTRHYLQRN